VLAHADCDIHAQRHAFTHAYGDIHTQYHAHADYDVHAQCHTFTHAYGDIHTQYHTHADYDVHAYVVACANVQTEFQTNTQT